MTRFIERHLAPALLLLCLTLGGASAGGVIANAGVQIASLVVIAFLLLGNRLPPLSGRSRLLPALVAPVAALMLAQLVPLPPAIWTMLPGRSEVAHSFALAGAGSPWLPISLAPDATLAQLLALLPPLAIIAAIYASSGHGRLYAVYVLILFAIASTALGLAQKMGGDGSPLYVYAVTNRGLPVGLFANRNHLATLLLTAIPFVAALAVSPSRRSSSDARIGRRILAGCVMAFLVLGVVYVRSDAGWLLVLPCLLASMAIFLVGERRHKNGATRKIGIIMVGTAAVLALFTPVVLKHASDKLTSAGSQKRSTIVTTTLRAAADYLPLGSGGGSFPVIYPSYEDLEDASFEYINHGHSDYSEFLLEYGIPGAGIVIFALAFWIACLPLLRPTNGLESGVMRASFVSLGMVAGHSLVDYPIRTAAIAAVVAMAAALLVAPPAVGAQPPHASRRRSRVSNRTITLGLADQPAEPNALLQG